MFDLFKNLRGTGEKKKKKTFTFIPAFVLPEMLATMATRRQCALIFITMNYQNAIDSHKTFSLSLTFFFFFGM